MRGEGETEKWMRLGGPRRAEQRERETFEQDVAVAVKDGERRDTCRGKCNRSGEGVNENGPPKKPKTSSLSVFVP